jgi:deoxyribodipyrimidine photo-lyase
MPDRAIPPLRLTRLNDRPERPEGELVLYWMIAARRPGWSFGLERAIAWAERFGKPLVVLEALRCDYRWACDRFHRFVLDGMAENARRFAGRRLLYYPYVEDQPGAGRGLVEALGARACVVVTDDFPSFFLPRMVGIAARRLPVLVEQVDGNGLLPLRATDRAFDSAHSFRRFAQRVLRSYLHSIPVADPTADLALPVLTALPAEVTAAWPPASPALLAGEAAALAELPIDHAVAPTELAGGCAAAERRLAEFVVGSLPAYAEDRRDLDRETTSGLSPYLHFGHISVHQVFAAVMSAVGWSPAALSTSARGDRAGWWGVEAGAEAFLDQLVIWRELAFNTSFAREDFDQYESLPAWALAALGRHLHDPRPWLYDREALEAAATHDPLWNAAQRQLRREGRMPGYLRMLWGKKALEWSASPREALDTLVHLNNKYALDGRNPNSYGGIFWCFGRYDRPWPPERPIFGTVRYMSSENTARKLEVRGYLQRFGPEESLF